MSRSIKKKIILTTLSILANGLALPQTQKPVQLPDREEIIEVMVRTANWQIANEWKNSKLDWEYGAFYSGIWVLYQTTGNPIYKEEIRKVGIASNWKLKNDIYHADRLTIAQSFADLYLEEKDPVMLEKIQWVMDMYIDRSAKADVRFTNNPYAFEWWTWCDALYMAPPTFARVYAATSNIKYLEYMDKHWWITSDYLYDTIDHLFYRDDRFPGTKTEHGKKVFWSRGNGWVVGGLVRVLQYLPIDYPTREKYIIQFREMAAKIASIQGSDGLWRSSLLDPEEFPVGESSGSAFFCYALAWGINNNILSKEEYLPHVLDAWKALVNNVNIDGRLGYVQQIGDSPKTISEDDWQVYGTGAFLLAGSEIAKLESTQADRL